MVLPLQFIHIESGLERGGGGVKIKKTSASIQDMEQKSYVTERQFLALFTQIEKFSGYGKGHLLLLLAPHN